MHVGFESGLFGPAWLAAEGPNSEWSEAAQAILGHLAGRLAAQGGAMLIVDYGYGGQVIESVPLDTLQAVHRGERVSPFHYPGTHDLTAHVDFSALAAIAHGRGLAVHGPVAQGALLGDLGIAARAEFRNQGDILWPGAIVDIELPLGEAVPHIAVPEGAVQTGRDAPFVWAVSSGDAPAAGEKPGKKVQMRDVVVAGRMAGTVYLASGLKPGEQIVVDALARLKDGDAVRLKGPQKPAIAGAKPRGAGTSAG